jgi:hypothetical protein
VVLQQRARFFRAPNRRCRYPEIRRSDSPPSDEPLRFFVELERDRIAWLVRFWLIKANEAHDLAAILAALKRIGLTPSISCSA